VKNVEVQMGFLGWEFWIKITGQMRKIQGLEKCKINFS